MPSATYNQVLMRHFPEDWEIVKKWYPLAEAKNIREKMIDENYTKWMEQEAAKRGGRMDVHEEEEIGEESEEKING